MLKHGDNYFFPIYDCDVPHVKFLLSRAKHDLSLRQARNRVKRAKAALPKINIHDLVCMERGMIDELPEEYEIEWGDDYEEESPLRGGRAYTRRFRKMEGQHHEKYHPRTRLKADRDPTLAKLLRKIIASKRATAERRDRYLAKQRRQNFINYYWRQYEQHKSMGRLLMDLSSGVHPQHQGNDEDAHGDSSTQIQDQASNVVLERQTEESEGIAPTVSTDHSFNLSTNDSQVQYDSFQDRFIHVKTFEWSSNKRQGDSLFDEFFPLYFLLNRDKTPNASFFKLFQYWKGDMEFKIQINSNPFQVGQLQCSWRYMDIANSNIEWYDNVQSLSQTTHALISANSNNAARIYVPYRYIKSSIATTKRVDQDTCLNMGKLRVKVLNQLHATSNSYHAVDVSIWVRFLNGKFSGMKAADIGSHQGLLDDIKQAEFKLNIDAKIDNTDKPPIQIAKEPVVVASNQSFCLGRNVTEPLNALRLDARGQSRNIENLSSQTKIKELSQIFGFVKTFTWAASDTSTKLLTTIDASPMFNLNEYAQGTVKADRFYNLPPVAVISEQFLYWRGSLEMRLDIIATDYHRGKLLVAYIPRELGTVTYTQALSSPHVVFDLRDKKQFSMIVPWITNVHYWQRRYGARSIDESISPPGKIHIFIQNRLVPMDNVRDRVDINLYWRGGKDFSVAVPALSALSLPWNAIDNKEKVEIRAYDEYYPYYVGQWRNFGHANRPILRYGKGMDHLALFEGFGAESKTEMQYYVYKGEQPLKCNVYTTDSAGKEVITLKEFKFGVRVKQDNYNYMAMATTEDEVKAYLDYQHYPKYRKEPFEALPIVDDKDEGTWGGQKNPIWDIKDYTPSPPEDYEIVEHQGDERESVECPPAQLVYNQFYETGSNVFGEDFVDLKDVARRYQPYSAITFQAGDSNSVDCLVPVQPWGLPIGTIDSTDKTKLYQKFNREGFIPILCSAYSFFRGSIRFRMVLNCRRNDVSNFFVAHFPEKHDIKVPTVPANNTLDQLLLSNYGFFIQSASVNNIVEFEVPYYMQFNSIFPNPVDTNKTEFSASCNMGTLAMGLSSSNANKGVLFYSLGDDAQLSCFQGWPSMILRIKGFSVSEHQGLSDWLFSSPLKVDVNLGLDKLLQMPEVQQLSATLKDLSTCTIEEIVSQVGHMLINPTVSTIAWSIVSILIKLRLFKFEYIGKCLEPFSRLAGYFSRFWTSDNQPADIYSREPRPEHQGVDEDPLLFAEVIGLILSALGLCLGLNVPTDLKKGNFLHLFKSIINGISGVSRSHSRIVAFITSSIKLVQKLTRYIVLWQNPDRLLEVMIDEEIPTLQLWTLEAHQLLNIENEDKVYTLGSTWANRMEVCYMLGCRIYQAIVQYKGEAFDPKYFNSFNILFKQICEKRDNMFRRGSSVVSRKDPFCVYIAGSPGIGKSVLASNLASSMIKKAQIPLKGEPIFTLPNGAKYWNGCRNQPCILIDDFLCVNTGTIQEEAIRAFMEIKSPAVLNPPMAHLQDKELRYAPEIVLVLSNKHFPVVNHCDLEAIYRRRDMLIDVELCDMLQEAGYRRISDTTREEIQSVFKLDMSKYEHLKFRYARDVTGGQSDVDTATMEGADWTRWMTWKDCKRTILNNFIAHRENQELLYADRVQALQELLDDDLEVPAGLDDKFQEYKHIIQALQILQPKKNCNFKEYLYLVQQAANGVPISDKYLETLIDIRNDTSKRLKSFQSQMQPSEHQGNDSDDEDDALTWEVFDPVPAISRYVVQYSFDKLKQDYTIHFSYQNSFFSSKLECSTVYPRKVIEERFMTALVNHGLSAKVYGYEEFLRNNEDLEVSENRVKKGIVVDIISGKQLSVVNRRDLDPYYDVLYAVVNSGDFKYGIDQYDKLGDDVCASLRCIFALNVPSGAACTLKEFDTSVRCLLQAFAGKGHTTMYYFMNEIISQLNEFDGLQPLIEFYFGKTILMSSPRVIRTMLGMTVIILMRDLTFKKIVEIIGDDCVKTPKVHLDVVYEETIQKLSNYLNEHHHISGVRLNSIRLHFQSIRDSSIDCPHLHFNPTAIFETTAKENYWRTSTMINGELAIVRAEDRKCELSTCPWNCEFWYRSSMNWWKKCNPTQVARLKKLPEDQKPRCLRKTSNTDYTWFETLKAMLDDMTRVAKSVFNILAGAIMTVLPLILDILLQVAVILGTSYGIYTTLHRVVKGEWVTFGQFLRNDCPLAEPYKPKTFNTFTEHHSVYNGKGQKPKVNKHQKFSNFFKPSADHEGFLEEGNHIMKAVVRSTFYVSAPGFQGVNKCLAIGDRYLIFMKHYYEFYKSKGVTHLTFQRHDSQIVQTFALDELKFIMTDENSTCICKLPKHAAPIKQIYHRFQNLDDYKRLPLEPVFVDVTPEGISTRTLSISRCEGTVIAATATQNEQVLSDIWQYNYGGKGKCGSPIVDLQRGCIIGIHVAGIESRTGFAEVFCRESFEALFNDAFDVEEPKYVSKVDQPPEKMKGQFEYFGVVDVGLEQHQSSETQLEPSLISGVFPSCRAPAPLGNKDPRLPEGSSPLYDGVNNMFNVAKPFPPELVKIAAQDVSQCVNAICKPVMSVTEPLSLCHAILGIPGVEYYDGLEMSTSEGYPMSRFRPPGASSKRWLFDIPEDRMSIGINSDLLSLMRLEMNNRMKGIVNPIVHDDCLKDSLIPIEKCSIPGKTRIFSISPVQFTIHFKQFFGHFLAAFKHARIQLEHAIGINPNGPEWGLALRYLSARGINFLCGDYSNFGPTLEVNCLRSAFDVIISWFEFNGCKNPTYKRIRQTMAMEVSHALHLCFRHMYRVPGGMPSGNPATVELNSLVNMMYIRIAWMEIMNQGTYRWHLDEYHINVRTLVYGDDIIMGVSDKVIDQFNNESLQKFFSKYNIKYTSADKKGNITKLSTIEDASFLKRKFCKHPNFSNEWLAPLPEDIVCDTANWIHKSMDPREATRINAVSCAAEAYGLGPLKYEQIRKKLLTALSRVGITTYIRTWEEWDRIHYATYYNL